MKRNKILIISHNPISNVDNMGKTIKNIFGGFKKEELCQLYLRNQKPDFNVCGNYFCINETSVLKSFFNKKIETGEIVKDFSCSEDDTNIDHNTKTLKSKIYNFGRKRNQPIYLARNFFWNHSNCYSENLKRWIKEQNPTCIFLMVGDYYFLFDIAARISAEFNIPVLSYVVDEFYFVKKYKQLIPLEATIYQKKFKKMYLNSKANFCICKSMCDLYTKEFNKASEVLMNCVDVVEPIKEIKINKDNLTMLYMGNISFDRFETLSLLSTAIANLNKKYTKKIEFTIYSGEKDQKLIDRLIANKDVIYGGSLSGEEVENRTKEADILVHAESFNPKNAAEIKYSISTKIPSLLNSNKVVIACGPEDVASIRYFKDNDAAIVITNENDVENSLEYLYKDIDYSIKQHNAHRMIVENHTKMINKEKIEKYL